MLGEERGRRLAGAQRGMRDEPAEEGQVRRDAADLGLVERGREPVERLLARRAARRSAWRSSGRSRSRSRRPRRRRTRRGSTRAAAGARSVRPAAGTSADPRRRAAPRRPRRAAAAARRAARPARSAAATARGRCPTRLPSRGARPGCVRSARGRRTRVPRARTPPCLRRRSRSRARSAPRRRVICARSSASSAVDGDSSSTFWWRRCTEHSRSPSASTVPCASASSWISTCRRPLEVALEVDAVVAEPGLRLAPGRVECVVELVARADDAHAAAAAAGGRLDDQRRLGRLGHGRHAGLGRDALRLELVAARRSASAGGPTQVRPAASTASAKSPFSARNP